MPGLPGPSTSNCSSSLFPQQFCCEPGPDQERKLAKVAARDDSTKSPADLYADPRFCKGSSRGPRKQGAQEESLKRVSGFEVNSEGVRPLWRAVFCSDSLPVPPCPRIFFLAYRTSSLQWPVHFDARGRRSRASRAQAWASWTFSFSSHWENLNLFWLPYLVLIKSLNFCSLVVVEQSLYLEAQGTYSRLILNVLITRFSGVPDPFPFMTVSCLAARHAISCDCFRGWCANNLQVLWALLPFIKHHKAHKRQIS